MKNNLAENDAKVGEFMSSNTIKTRIQLKNDTEANWNQAQNFIPKAGEVIIYSGDNSRPFSRLKVGDGITVVTALPFIHSGVMSINGLEPNISGNFELSAEAIGLNKPLNIVGFLTEQNNVDLTTGTPIMDIPSIIGLASYTPKEGDVVLDNKNGVEFACIQIKTIEVIDEETEEEVEETFYLWKQLGKNAAAVFQKDLMGTSENHNYPITLSPQIDAIDTTDKILKDIYFNFNPVNNNLTIGSDLTPGTINGKPIGSAMSKDFIDYNYEVFPNGLNYKGIAINLSSGIYNTYTLENKEFPDNAEHGDLVYLNSETEENSGYYIFHLKEPINTSTWDKMVAKNIGQSDKLITERLLYYYEGNGNISKLGTITQGTWNGNVVDVAHGGTGVNSFVNNGILYAGLENNTTVVRSGVISWSNWENGTSNGPVITLRIGNVTSPLQYNLPAIPIATNDNSGVITTTSQDIKGVKTFTSGTIGLRCVNTKLNQILFGTENLSDFSTGDQLIGDSEFASINVKMPFNTTQFSFRQFKINNSEENDVITYSKNSSVYEEYLLPEINNDIASTQTYNILTTKSLVTVAEGGTGQSSFDANKILYGNGSGSIQSEIPEWKAWVAGTIAGPQAVFHIGNADYTSAAIPAADTDASGIVTNTTQSFAGIKTFTSQVILSNTTDVSGSFASESALVIGTKTGYHLAFDTDEIMAKSNATTPSSLYLNYDGGDVVIGLNDNNYNVAIRSTLDSSSKITGALVVGGGAGFGGTVYANEFNGPLTGHASLDLPLTGGTMTGSIHFSKDSPLIFNYTASTETPVLVLNNAPNYGIRYTEGTPDTMKFSASGNANTNDADLCINGAGDGTVTIRGNTILHTGNWRQIIFTNKNRSLSTLTVGDSSWAIVPSGATDVFGLSFKDTALSTDTGDWRMWLEQSGTAATLNMRIDGNIQATTFIGALSGNASTATRINGNLGQISSDTNCNIWVSSTSSADGIPKYVTGVYVHASTGRMYAKEFRTSHGYINGSATNGGINMILTGDDAWIGDCNIAGTVGIKANSGAAAGVGFYGADGTNRGRIYYDANGGHSTTTFEATGYLKSTVNSNTITIGSQNTSWTHIYSSANIPFIFNNRVCTTTGGLGNSSYPWSDLWLKGPIYYQGTAGGYTPISFKDSGDVYGLGIIIGAGGLTCIGGGESAPNVAASISSGGSEQLCLSGDNGIDFYVNCQNGMSSAVHTSISASGTYTHEDSGVSYVAGSKGDHAALYAKKAYNQDHWYPAVALETKGGGAWQIGNYNDETLEFVYFPKDKRDNNTNSGQTEVYLTSAGEFVGRFNSLNLTNICFDWSGSYSTGSWMLIYNGETGTFGGAKFKAINQANTAAWVDGAHKWTRIGGDTMTGDLFFADSGTTTRQIRGIVGANDYWRIAGGATASNSGWMEIATADDGNEPIYVRQYTGAYATITRTLTLLDASGNTSLPGNLTISHATSETMTADSANPKITFAENESQPVHLIYSDYDSYRAPAGLKVIGGTSATPAWFEVEGQVYAARFNGPLTGNVTGNCSGSSGSCTGNAATASSSPKLTLQAGNVSSTSTNTYATNGLNVRWFSTANCIPGQPTQYGFLLTMASGDGSAENHQIFATQSNGDLYHRGTNGSSYTSPPGFKTILDSSNYTSYTVTKTGSGASGTWGINITGNAANVTGTVAIAHGGTGASGPQEARQNLGFRAGAYTFGKFTAANSTQTATITLSGTMNRVITSVTATIRDDSLNKAKAMWVTTSNFNYNTTTKVGTFNLHLHSTITTSTNTIVAWIAME